MSLAVSSNWLCNFAVGLVTPKLLDRIQYATYLFYAAWNVVGFVVVYFTFVETMGKSLEDIDEIFDDGASFSSAINATENEKKINEKKNEGQHIEDASY
jgi:hypothetical protein